MRAPHNQEGFTLIESIVYIGLFGIMVSGLFISIYPFFTGAEQLSRNITIEGESAFMLRKIHFALSQHITSAEDNIVIPPLGSTTNKLVIAHNETESVRFELDDTQLFCTPPLLCHMLLYGKHGEALLPLNNERVSVKDFTVSHTQPHGDTSRRIEIFFTLNDVPVGPVYYYVHF